MSDVEFFDDIEQGSPEWYELRRGIPTASEFQTIIAGGKGRETYIGDLAGEILSGQVTEGFQSGAMMRGKEMEAEAADHFARTQMRDLRRTGFIRRRLASGRFVGCSPDRLFGAKDNAENDTILEIKTMKPRLMIEKRRNGYDPNRCPAEHMAQVQGAMWVSGLPRAELIIFYRGMPFMLHYSVSRDEAYINSLAAHVEDFDRKLDAIVKQCRGFK